MDCSRPGSSTHGILQARTLEWVTIPFCRGSSWPRDQTGSFSLPEDSLASEPPRDTFSSVQFSCSVMSDSLPSHGLQHARPPCPSPTPGVYSNSCPSRRWCLPTISPSVVPFSSCLQSFPASGSFPMSQFFTSGGQRIGVSASVSVLPMNIQDWFPLGLTSFLLLDSQKLNLDQRSWINLRLLLNVAKLLSTKIVPVYPHQ